MINGRDVTLANAQISLHRHMARASVYAVRLSALQVRAVTVKHVRTAPAFRRPYAPAAAGWLHVLFIEADRHGRVHAHSVRNVLHVDCNRRLAVTELRFGTVVVCVYEWALHVAWSGSVAGASVRGLEVCRCDWT